ncbi:unnamed protein product [Symbiodinium natans]|uniref:Uncharacterized protein n=1 Tax=Symbiodinium natans TaxID=878477 RepID=A0A812URV9_9DINO|nr:unnamed protein product [Symbiodinium natans]
MASPRAIARRVPLSLARWLPVFFLFYAGGTNFSLGRAQGDGFTIQRHIDCKQLLTQGVATARGPALPRYASPTEEERKAARDMLRETPVGEMGTSIGEDGASTLYTIVGGLFFIMLLLTAAVVSGAVG